MEQTVTCINCPVGCRMNVVLSDTGDFISVTGNTCPRGAVYARQESILPVRMITAVIPVNGSSTPLSVKTSCPIPKSFITKAMKELSNVCIDTQVRIGQVIISDILDTGADIVATRTLD